MVRELSTSCFTWTQAWKLSPVSAPESSVTSTLIPRLQAKGRHQQLSSKQSERTTPLALPLAGTQSTSHSKSCPKILPAVLFSSWKTLPYPFPFHIKCLLVGKYFVHVIPQDITDQATESLSSSSSRRPVARLHGCKQDHPGASHSHSSYYTAHACI